MLKSFAVHASVRLVVLCAGFCGVAGQAQAPKAQPLGKPMTYKTVNGQQLHAYVTAPPEDGAMHPAIVFFHGGGWTGGSVTQFAHQATELAARGMVTVNVQYRLVEKAPSLESPKVCVEDAKSAMRWVKAHAKELHIDTKKIVASGGSAGGYLAAATAFVPEWNDPQDDLTVSPAPSALVLFFPVLDISPAGYGQKRFGDDFAKYAPSTYLSAKMPPMLIEAGSADKLVKPDTLRNFKALCEKAGGRCELDFYPDQGHGFANTEPYNSLTLNVAIKFLKSLGYLDASVKDVAVPTAPAKPSGDTPGNN